MYYTREKVTNNGSYITVGYNRRDPPEKIEHRNSFHRKKDYESGNNSWILGVNP
jgi:hypothetical protein